MQQSSSKNTVKYIILIILSIAVLSSLLKTFSSDRSPSVPPEPSGETDPVRETPSTEAPQSIHEHHYSSEVIPPDCTKSGYTLHICDCGDEYHDEEVPPTGHVLEEWKTVASPTCSETGTEECVCSVCGEKTERSVETLPHHYEKGICTACGTIDPTIGDPDNPIPSENTISVPYKEFTYTGPEYRIQVVGGIIRGEDANRRVADANMFNQKPTANQEWVILAFEVRCVSSSDGSEFNAFGLFQPSNLYTRDGARLPVYSSFVAGGAFSAYGPSHVDLLPGGEGMVLFPVLIDKGKEGILLKITGPKGVNWLSCDDTVYSTSD